MCMHLCQVIGEDACPGLKQNGFPYLIRRIVECSCPGDAIPASIEVDISGLNLGQTVLLPHLKLPSGIKLVAPVWLRICLDACLCILTPFAKVSTYSGPVYSVHTSVHITML